MYLSLQNFNVLLATVGSLNFPFQLYKWLMCVSKILVVTFIKIPLSTLLPCHHKVSSFALTQSLSHDVVPHHMPQNNGTMEQNH
jgi:hypothetical protein